jgi:hypothetical protein
MKPVVEKRHSPLRRHLNEMATGPDGRFSESKAWASVGKLCCVYLLMFHTEPVLHEEYTLLTLLTFVIAPDLVKKFMMMRFNANVPK